MRCHFGQLWYGEAIAASNVVDYAKFYSRSHDAVIRVYDEAGNVIQTRPAVSKSVVTTKEKRRAAKKCRAAGRIQAARAIG